MKSRFQFSLNDKKDEMRLKLIVVSSKINLACIELSKSMEIVYSTYSKSSGISKEVEKSERDTPNVPTQCD